MNRSGKVIICIYAVVIVLINIVFFLIPFSRHSASWIMYAFSMVSLLGSCMITMFSFLKSDLKSKVYGFPVFWIGCLYSIFQIVAGVLICTLDALFEVPLWISVILSAVLLGLAMIGFAVTNQTRESIMELERNTVRDTAEMTCFILNVSSLVPLCKDPILKRKMEKLSEKFRYSDPVSNSKLQEIEDKISMEIDVLTQMLGKSENEMVFAKIDEIEVLLQTRNDRCRAMK